MMEDQVKQFLIMMTLTIGLFLVACNGGDPTATPTDSAPTATLPPLLPPPTDAPYPGPDDPGGYPGPGEPLNPTPELPPGYPPPTEAPPYDPYPGGVAFVIAPLGLQCEEPTFPDITTAVAALEAGGVTVESFEEVDLAVCAACGCPTSRHFRVAIAPTDLELARQLGWVRE